MSLTKVCFVVVEYQADFLYHEVEELEIPMFPKFVTVSDGTLDCSSVNKKMKYL